MIYFSLKKYFRKRVKKIPELLLLLVVWPAVQDDDDQCAH
jgi:hypothetical protein